MSDLTFFDSHCYLGRYKHLRPGGFYTKDGLFAEMDHFGISEALVVDVTARENHPEPGNMRILEECHGEARLHPAWVLLPARGGEIGPVDTLVGRMRSAGVGAAFMYPRNFDFPLEAWCIGDVCAALEANGVPLFVDPNIELNHLGWDETDWDALVRLAKQFPALPIVAAEGRMRSSNRAIYQAMDLCPNLYVELSGFWVHHGIEFVTREFGSDRLLFGTRMPVREVGGTIMQVKYADISDAAKRNIAGDNLRRLLARAFGQEMPETDALRFIAADEEQAPELARDRIVLPRPAEGELHEKVFDAASLEGETIIDIHSHIGTPSKWYHLADNDVDSIYAEVKRFNVSRSVTFSFTVASSDFVMGNDYVYLAWQRYPRHFVPLCGVNPWHPDEMMAELDRCWRLGFPGVKLIPYYQGYPETGEGIRRAVEWANERKMIVLNHNWGPNEWLDDLAQSNPDATLICGHLTSYPGEVVNRRENVYLCTCEPLVYRQMEDTVAQINVDRILFGSDITDLPIAMGLGPILYAHIGDEAKRKILGLNAERLLARVLPNVVRP